MNVVSITTNYILFFWEKISFSHTFDRVNSIISYITIIIMYGIIDHSWLWNFRLIFSVICWTSLNCGIYISYIIVPSHVRACFRSFIASWTPHYGGTVSVNCSAHCHFNYCVLFTMSVTSILCPTGSVV